MDRSINLAIVGATGLVGEAIIKLLADRKFPVGELFVLASENGAGSKISFAGKSLTVRTAEGFDFSQVEVALFAAGASVSQALAPHAAESGAVVVDLSPAYRYEADIPLVVADVNDEMLAQAREQNLVACADASTVQLLRALKPLRNWVRCRMWWLPSFRRHPPPARPVWTSWPSKACACSMACRPVRRLRRKLPSMFCR